MTLPPYEQAAHDDRCLSLTAEPVYDDGTPNPCDCRILRYIDVETAKERLVDAVTDPHWEAKRMAQEPAASRPALDVRVWWWLDDHGPKWAAARAWRLHQWRLYRRARREDFGA